MPDQPLLQTVNEFIENALRPIGKPIGQLFGGVTGLVAPQYSDIAARTGEALPRLGAEAAFYAAKRIPFKALGLADVALKSYTQPGADLESTLAQTGAFALSPFTGRALGGKVARMMEPSMQQIASPGARYWARQAAERVGGIAGGVAPFEVANALEAYRSGEPYRPLAPENLVGLAANVLPFEALHVPGMIKGYRRAISPLVNQTPITDQVPSWDVSWQAHDEPRKRNFTDQQTAQDFSDELRKQRFEPFVSPSAMVPRSYIEHSMAFKPEDLQAGFLGLRTHEVLRDMPQRDMPGEQMAGYVKNRIPPNELEALPGFEEFLKAQPRANPQQALEWLKENGPRVEVRTIGEGGGSPEQREFVTLTHEWFDNLPLEITQEVNRRGTWSPTLNTRPEFKTNEFLTKLDNYIGLRNKVLSQPMNEAQWQSIAPKPESEMRDYVEGAVVVPVKRGTPFERSANRDIMQLSPESAERFGVLFPSSHHFPPNTLGWFRGYMEPLANGKKVFHIVELQSDWAQQQRDALERAKERPIRGQQEREIAAIQAKGHPLLSQWESITLKAAIDHAIRNGADEIAVSDAKTAMMTEGHDQRAAMQIVPDLRGVEKPTIEQEKGMVLHYDQTIPQALRKLTGEKGVVRDFGEHNMAFVGDDPRLPLGGDANITPRPDLILRNPDGSLKTTVTANSFSLAKTKAELARRGGFPMFGSEKFIKDHIERLSKEGYDPDQIAASVQNIRQLQPLPGESLTQTLARSVGLDPNLLRKMAPGEANARAFDFFTAMFHYNYGYDVQKAANLAKQAMVPWSRLQPFLQQTSLAIAPAKEGASKMYGVKPLTADMPQYLIALFDYPNFKNLKQGPEAQIFSSIRTLAHESWHNTISEVMNPTGNATLEQRRMGSRALIGVESIPPKERAPIVEGMLKLIVPPKFQGEISRFNMQRYETNPEEMLADVGALLAMGATDSKGVQTIRDAMTFGDAALQDFGNAIYRDISSAWSGFREMVKLTFPQGQKIAKAIDDVYNNLNSLMVTRQKAERMRAGFEALVERATSKPLDPPPSASMQQMHALFREIDKASGAVMGVLPKAYTEAAESFTEQALAWIRPYETPRVAGERMGFWDRNIKPMAQLVESLRNKVPSAVDVKALGFDYRGKVSQAQTDTWKLWAPDTPPTKWQQLLGGIADWKRLRWLGKDESPQERAFSTIGLVENVRTQLSEADIPLTREGKEKVSPEYKALSDEDKAKVDKSLEQAWAMTRLLARRQWDAHRDRVSWGMTRIIMSFNKNLYHGEAKPLADQAVHWVFDEPGDIEQQPAWRAQRDAFFASLPLPDIGKKTLEEKINDNLEPWQKLGDRLLGTADTFTGERPGRMAYLPEVRTRDWHIAFKVKDEDVPHHEAFKSEALLAKRFKEVDAMPDKEWVKTFNRTDRTERFRGLVQEEITSAQQDALDALLNSVVSGISSDHPEAQDIITRLKQEFQPATAFSQVTVSPYMREREFIPGREKLNMVEGLVRYVDAVSYQIAKRYVKEAGQVVLFNPDMRANPDVRNKFDQYLRFVTDAEGKEFNFLKNLVFFHYIGFNPATALVEPTQRLITLVPYMIENGMGIGQAYDAVRKSTLDVLKDNFTPLEEKALQEAITKRTVDTGFTADLYGETDLDFAAQNSAIMGNDNIASKADLFKKPLYQMLAVARHAYSWFTASNGKTAFLTAFRHEFARASGDETARYNKAVAFATQATDATMYGGGRASRPMILQRFGSMSGVGGVMYTLGSYTINTVTMMARLFRKSVMSDATMTAAEKKDAMKAGATMFVTQLAFGGVLGLPLVAAGLAALEQVFPGFNAMDLMRGGAEQFGKLVSNDSDWGHTVADGAMRGALNVGPADVGSRFQLGNLLGVSPYDGFSWANLMGPAANMLGGYVKAVGSASQGNWYDASQNALPVSMRQIARLVHDDFNVRDKAGRLVEETSPVERAFALAGFKPKAATDYYERQHIQQRIDENYAKKAQTVRSDAANMLTQGDVAGARTRILQGMEEAGPYDPIEMARSAAQLAVEMGSVSERRHGTRATAERLAQLAGLYPKGANIGEVQRVLQQTSMMSQMGFGRPNMGQMRTASLVDALMAQNPKLSLTQARLLASRMTSPAERRRQALYQSVPQ